jgi:hypothetical protein
LKFHVAFPVESAVAFRLDVPFGPVIVKTTAAPDEPAVPCVTIAAIVTFEPRVTGIEGTVTEIASGSTTEIVFTVRFARPSTEVPAVDAMASTPYVAETVPAGTDFLIVVELVAPGETVIKFWPKAVGHAPGSRDDMVKLRGEQEDVSLLVTATV